MAGQKIDDHSSWVGKGSGGVVFPSGAKHKAQSSQEGAGGVMEYPDSAEAIKRDQGAGVAKMQSHKIKSGFRN